jgi:glycosyltransferase involved in cell wall biosynthesis
MRILFVQQDVNLWGAPRSLLTLINYLKNRQHVCAVLLHSECPFGAEVRRQGIECEVVPRRNWTYPEDGARGRRIASGLYSLGANVLYADRAIKIVGRFKPELIHTNSSKTPFGAILAWKMSVPHVWHFREFLGGPFTTGIVFSLGQALSCRFVERSSSAAVVISEALKQHLAFCADRISTHVVYNGVMPADVMRKAAATPMPNTRILTLAWVGRFDGWKHPLVPLEAMKLLRKEEIPVRLIIAGTGTREQVESLQCFIRDHSLEDAVELRGFVHNMSEIYNQSHALVMSSTGDAFGRVTAEAMAYGRSVIGADACATSELVEHEKNGLLFRPCDSQDLARQIHRLVQDRELVVRLGTSAAEKATHEFTNEKYGSRMEEIFRTAISGA